MAGQEKARKEQAHGQEETRVDGPDPAAVAVLQQLRWLPGRVQGWGHR